MTHKRPGRAERERRQTAANERQEAREKRSVEEQIALLDSRPGQSLRERERLGA